MTPPLRLGLVGCGRIAQLVHLHTLTRLRGANVVALAEPDDARRREAAALVPGARAVADHQALLADPDVDAVVLALPPALHAATAQQAFSAGKHVYLEKPGATSAAEAAAVTEAWRRSGRVGMIGLNYRYHPLHRALRAAVQERRVGDLVGIRSMFGTAARTLPPWKTRRSEGGGVLLDLGVHHVDLVRFVTGREVDAVTASVRSLRTDDDTAAVTLRMVGGLIVELFVSMTTAEQDRIEVLGTDGMLVVDRLREPRLRVVPARRASGRGARAAGAAAQVLGLPGRVLESLRAPAEPSYRAALQAFVDAARGGDPAAVITPADGFASLDVVLAAEESAREGRTVTLAGTAPATLVEAAVPATAVSPAVTSTTHASPDAPAMSVIVVTPDRFATIRRTVRFLRAQTVQPRLELVLVGPTDHGLADHEPHELEGFHGVRMVAVGPIDNVDRAGAHGVRVATAPVVAFVEDHAYPDPGWATALLQAHEGPWAAVGSAMRNANPDSALSWTNLLLAYGSWTEPVTAGETASVSRHNISFKRDVLLSLDGELERLLGREGGLLARLGAMGHRFYLEPEARIEHANPSLLSSTVALRFKAGRLASATRAQGAGWSPGRRALYVLGSPAFPLLRARPLRGKVAATGLGLRAYPALMLGLVLDGAGQAMGFALGPGRTAEELADFEVDRLRHVTMPDRQLLAH